MVKKLTKKDFPNLPNHIITDINKMLTAASIPKKSKRKLRFGDYGSLIINGHMVNPIRKKSIGDSSWIFKLLGLPEGKNDRSST